MRSLNAEHYLGWRVTFEVVDLLTGSHTLALRPFEDQPHGLDRKWKVYTENRILKLVIYLYVSGPLQGLFKGTLSPKFFSSFLKDITFLNIIHKVKISFSPCV